MEHKEHMENKKFALRRKRVVKENVIGYAFLSPWIAFFLVFTLFPFAYGFILSLYDYTLKGKNFVGFGNYTSLFQNSEFLSSIFVTFKMVLIIIPGTMIVSLLIAYAIRGTKAWFQATTKVIFYLTSIVSQVALVMVWKWMFNPSYGMYATLTSLLEGKTLDLLGNPILSIPLISILVMSFTISQPVVLFSAAMDGVDVSLYEAADIDGASHFTKFRKITLPCIAPTILFVLVTTTINNLQVFVVPYLLTGGGPAGSTTPVLLLIYQNAFEYGKFGYASAMGVLLFILIAFFVSLQFKVQQMRED